VAKGRNGKGAKIQCPNAPDCVVAQAAADTLSLIDSRLVEMQNALQRVHEEALDFRKAVLDSHDEVLSALRRLEREDA
jgi:uncharacterized protein (DUF1499 family)